MVPSYSIAQLNIAFRVYKYYSIIIMIMFINIAFVYQFMFHGQVAVAAEQQPLLLV